MDKRMVVGSVDFSFQGIQDVQVPLSASNISVSGDQNEICIESIADNIFTGGKEKVVINIVGDNAELRTLINKITAILDGYVSNDVNDADFRYEWRHSHDLE